MKVDRVQRGVHARPAIILPLSSKLAPERLEGPPRQRLGFFAVVVQPGQRQGFARVRGTGQGAKQPRLRQSI